MPTKKNLVIIAGALLMVGAVLTHAADPEASPPTTPAEHAAAASAYDAEAKQAQAKAATHQLMADRYRSATVPQKGLRIPMTAMANHCQKLADSYKQAASEASIMAKIHREAAAGGE